MYVPRTVDGMKAIINEILATDVVGVVFFGFSPEARLYIQTASIIPCAGRLQTIFSEGLGPVDSSVDSEREPISKGVMATTAYFRALIEYLEHFVNIDEMNPIDNRWFQEAYMNLNKCQLPGYNTTAPYEDYTPCVLKNVTTKTAEFVQHNSAEAAIFAVYTFAKALKDAHATLCGGTPGLCPPLVSLTQEEFFKNYILKVDLIFGPEERIPSLAESAYPTNTPRRIQYDANGDLVDNVFGVYQYQNVAGTWKFVLVAIYVDGTLTLLPGAKLEFYSVDRSTLLATTPTSTCSPTDGVCCPQSDSDEDKDTDKDKDKDKDK